MFVTINRYGGDMARPEPISRRDRPAKPPLSRAAILDAAVAIVQRDGAGALTMRRLATELDTGPASLYVYVRNTTELNALLIDRYLSELDLSWDGREAWRDRLQRVVDDYAALLASQPGLATAALTTWPDGHHYLDLLELLMRLLAAAGVDTEAAARGVDLLLQHATASAAEWAAHATPAGQELADLTETLESATAERHPTLHAAGAAVFTSGTPEERTRWATTAIVNGILESGRG
ncbi:TetR/AcrR family transcriptional regulator [Cnuibacter sp. UC19_7]|uniref:TetR/AcrR family transcriptional regulator n=1 Tax=Cnuibacter sp. UC19_7 TaxID=3350166 RepID=UPI00366ED417